MSEIIKSEAISRRKGSFSFGIGCCVQSRGIFHRTDGI